MNEQNNNLQQGVVNSLNNIPIIPPGANNQMPISNNNVPSQESPIPNQNLISNNQAIQMSSVIPNMGSNGSIPTNQISNSGPITLGETPNMTYNEVISGGNNFKEPPTSITNQSLTGTTLNTGIETQNLPNASVTSTNNSTSLNQPITNNISESSTAQNIETNNYNETFINDLNVDGTYNKMEKPEYINDPQVRENMNPQKKNTVTITKELKTFIIISLILLVFIFIMPSIFDLIRSIKY